MKKLGFLIPVVGLLAACSNYNPDLEVAAEKRAKNRAEIRDEIGCQFADTQTAYRNCLLATYRSQKPKTFSTTTTATGQTVAVVSSSTMVASTEVYAQPVNNQGVIALNADGSVACSSVPGQPCTYQTQGEVYEKQVPAIPCGAPVVEEPKTVTVTTTETVIEKPVEVVPMPEPLPEKTWWETYQEEKAPEAPKVVCPCPDPNDPCPQCNSK